MRTFSRRNQNHLLTHRGARLDSLLAYLRWSDRGRRSERLRQDWREARRAETLLRITAIAVTALIMETALTVLARYGVNTGASISVRLGSYMGLALPVLAIGASDLALRSVGRTRLERLGLRRAAKHLDGDAKDGWPIIAQLLRLSCGRHLPEEERRWTVPWGSDQPAEADRKLAMRLLRRLERLPLEPLSRSSQELAGRENGCWRCGAVGIRGQVRDIDTYRNSSPARQRMLAALQAEWGTNWGVPDVAGWLRLGWDDEDLFPGYLQAARADLTDPQAETAARLVATWTEKDLGLLLETARKLA